MTPTYISSKTFVAYVVVSWNNIDILQECIESVDKQTHKNKIIFLVDNNSSDGTVEYIRDTFPQVKILNQTSNLGFAKANNIGIRTALEDINVGQIVLLNSDARLAEEWTEKLLKEVDNKPKFATAQSLILDYYDHKTIDSTHIYINKYGQATQGSFRNSISENPFSATRQVFGCNAAAVLISRSFIEAQPFEDFFDEDMFMYLEDVDVATRATVMGWQNYFVKGTTAYHMGSASSSKRPGYSLRMTYRNNIGLLIKNLPMSILLPIIIRLPKSDFSSSKHLIKTKRTGDIKNLFLGRLQGLASIPKYIKKRRQLKPYTSNNVEELKQLIIRGY